ncbi:MAG: 3-oxoacyl-[acyl-carrier-protein] reductase [Clostridiaceae bacterium]
MLKGKNAIVTGGARGIGRSIALKLAEEGANIVLNYRSSGSFVDELVSEIEAKGVKCVAVQGDVSVHSEAEALIKAAVENLGSLDILVNNAGITKDGLIMRMKEEDFDSVINTNLKGAFNTIKFASAVMMKQKRGTIINMASVVGILGNPGQANYVASKAGIIGMTKSVAKELGSRGITCNAVAPGFIQTDMTEVLNEKQKTAMMDVIPLKRAGSVDDVSNVVAFLASEKAGYITGQVISVDGGMAM